jgi:hypothetical protein
VVVIGMNASSAARGATVIAAIAAQRAWVSSRHAARACLGSRPGRPGGDEIGMRKLPAKGCKII